MCQDLAGSWGLDVSIGTVVPGICILVTSQQGHSLDMSLVIDPQGQNKKARVLSASYKD